LRGLLDALYVAKSKDCLRIGIKQPKIEIDANIKAIDGHEINPLFFLYAKLRRAWKSSLRCNLHVSAARQLHDKIANDI
jgi:hypothetical protein